MALGDIFYILSDPDNYRLRTKTRIAKIILGSSVIRVFRAGTKLRLLSYLITFDVDSVANVLSQEDFNQWHMHNVNNVFQVITEDGNYENIPEEGLRWGHSTKILNLFLGHLIFYSNYFQDFLNVEEAKKFLHVPLDSKAFEVLRDNDVEDVPTRIKWLTSESYYRLQNEIRNAAAEYDLPPIYFDEYAWANEG